MANTTEFFVVQFFSGEQHWFVIQWRSPLKNGKQQGFGDLHFLFFGGTEMKGA